jgi:hypothetical protein
VSDELARLISGRQTRKSAAAAAAEATRKEAEEIASTVPQQWSKASQDLVAAIQEATSLFADKGEPLRHFKWQPRPQADRGNFARVYICHRDTGMPGDLSQTVVSVGLNGVVYVNHPYFERSYKLSQVAREDWDLLLAEIYDQDEQSLENRRR